MFILIPISLARCLVLWVLVYERAQICVHCAYCENCRKCRRLVLYGSLTLIGPDSTYLVEETEEIAGAKLMREQEADWDW